MEQNRRTSGDACRGASTTGTTFDFVTGSPPSWGEALSKRRCMSLVKRLMEQIEGSAEIRSDHGTASLRFPVAKPPEERSPRAGSPISTENAYCGSESEIMERHLKHSGS